MAAKVNLDALIRREDFEISDPTQHRGAAKQDISHRDMEEKEFFFSVLRKPDFQRETNEWDSKRIYEFLKSFLDGDLIPAIILWQSQSSCTFVIDGSHRLSALAAWVNDDYGDGVISKRFYDGIIPEEQIRIAQRTRNLVRKEIGSFQDHKLALDNPGNFGPGIIERSKRLGTLAIQVQWVQGGASKAESSFFKINEQGIPVNETELQVLKARKQPNGIAARAIIRSGRGHKYWSAFPGENQGEIETLAREIHGLLFRPPFDSPIKTLDLPVGGSPYAAQSLPLVLDFINIVNSVATSGSLQPDNDGLETIRFLKACRKVAQRINSNHPCSLGLHPVVYFYSPNGRHKTASFHAITALILDFEKRNSFPEFTRIRESFETFLVKYEYLIQQIVRQYRGATGSYPRIKDFYLLCMDKLLQGKDVDETASEVMKDSRFGYLTPPSTDKMDSTRQDFTKETKSEAYIRTALQSAVRCKICNGYIHRNAISFDHIERREDGGSSSVDNAQLTHPYCNTGIKS